MTTHDQSTRLPAPIATAVIDGAITNTVKLIGPRGGRSKGRKPPRRSAAGVVAVEPRVQTRSTKGIPKLGDELVIQVCVSMPPAELAAIDAMAKRCQMNRSAFVRAAAEYFIEHVRPKKPADAERPVSKAQLAATKAEILAIVRAELAGIGGAP
jgi:hypothetical protein